MASIRDSFPLKLTIDSTDYTPLLDEGFTFSNTDPGGYEMASFPFPRDLPQIMRGDNVRVDCGTQVAWEGRVREIQRSLGAKTLVQCEGYGALLKDQQESQIFIDRDLSRWQSATVREQQAEEGKNNSPQAPVVGSDPTGKPGLIASFNAPTETVGRPVVSGWYYAGTNFIGKVYYRWEKNANVKPGDPGTEWFWGVSISTDDIFTTTTATGNLAGAGPGEAYLPVGATYLNVNNHRKYAVVQFFNGDGITGANLYSLYWQNLAVYGTHELTLRGTSPGGLYTSDIASWIAERAAGIKPGVIPTNSTFIVPHLVYYTPVEWQQMLSDIQKLVGCHWGVWESETYLTGDTTPRLDFRPYPQQGEPTAWALREECETLDIREDLSTQYNEAVVQYTTVSGVQEAVTVKFPNPVLSAAGITQRSVNLSLGTSDTEHAELFGKLALEVQFAQARVVGSALIKEPIQRMTGAEFPAWLLKSGIDRLRIPDLPSVSAFGEYNDMPISRVECTGSSEGIQTSIEFGQKANLLETITAQLQQAAPAAQGGPFTGF